MDLNSPTTLLAAWLLVPALVALASAGLGLGLARIAGLPLGALTLPAGLLAGVALISVALLLGAGPEVSVGVCAALALAWPLAAAARAWRRGARRPRLPEGAGWAAGAALAAYAVGMAPLVAGGHSAVLGYVLNNDSAIHIGQVEALAQYGAEPVAVGSDSFHNATRAFDIGYPLGSYAWPLFGRVLTGTDPFHTWSPLVALSLAMLALVAFGVLRMLGAQRPFAAVAGALVAIGYLPLSYLAQGGAKEVLLPVTVLGALALGVRAYESGITRRSPLPAVVAAAAAAANLGATAAAWLVPAAVALFAAIAWRATRRDSFAELRAAGLYAAAALVVAAPAAVASLSFLDEVREVVDSARQAGNLLGPVPLEETLNVWLVRDYRLTSGPGALTAIGLVLAGALALAGLAHALRRRRLGLPLIVGTALVACAAIYPQVSIYFEAKTLTVLAPALGLATAAGVLWLVSAGGPARIAGALAGGLVAIGVVASAAHVYAGVWTSPDDRLEELADIGDRFAGQGRILVNDREYYSAHLLHEVGPWDDWSERQPEIGLRGGAQLPLPHTPDFDDYRLEHFARFRLLLERKAPAASRPPASFEPVAETAHYRVWRRSGPDPRMHVPLDGREPLDCSSPDVRRLVRAARENRSPITVSLPGPEPLTAVEPAAWRGFPGSPIVPPEGQIVRRGGSARAEVELPPGEWTAWLQGSYGPGVRLVEGGVARGEVSDDLGFSSAWHDLGRLTGGRRAALTLTGIERSLAVPGSRHIEITGPLVLAPAGAEGRVERVSPDELRSRICGRRVDWLELPLLE